MRWLTFLILMVFGLVVQSALAPRIEVWGCRPDLLLVLVVFIAMHAAAKDALIGAWLIGACADVMTIERFGVLALSYTLAALLILSFRDLLFREDGWPQFIVTLGVCMLVHTAWVIYAHSMYDPASSVLFDLTVGTVVASLYTAMLAPPFHGVLLRQWRSLGLPRPAHVRR